MLNIRWRVRAPLRVSRIGVVSRRAWLLSAAAAARSGQRTTAEQQRLFVARSVYILFQRELEVGIWCGVAGACLRFESWWRWWCFFCVFGRLGRRCATVLSPACANRARGASGAALRLRCCVMRGV